MTQLLTIEKSQIDRICIDRSGFLQILQVKKRSMLHEHTICLVSSGALSIFTGCRKLYRAVCTLAGRAWLENLSRGDKRCSLFVLLFRPSAYTDRREKTSVPCAWMQPSQDVCSLVLPGGPCSHHSCPMVTVQSSHSTLQCGCIPVALLVLAIYRSAPRGNAFRAGKTSLACGIVFLLVDAGAQPVSDSTYLPHCPARTTL